MAIRDHIFITCILVVECFLSAIYKYRRDYNAFVSIVCRENAQTTIIAIPTNVISSLYQFHWSSSFLSACTQILCSIILFCWYYFSFAIFVICYCAHMLYRKYVASTCHHLNLLMQQLMLVWQINRKRGEHIRRTKSKISYIIDWAKSVAFFLFFGPSLHTNH